MVLGSSDLIKSLAEINIHNEVFCLRSPAKSIPESKDSIRYIFHLYKLLTTAEIKMSKRLLLRDDSSPWSGYHREPTDWP